MEADRRHVNVTFDAPPRVDDDVRAHVLRGYADVPRGRRPLLWGSLWGGAPSTLSPKSALAQVLDRTEEVMDRFLNDPPPEPPTVLRNLPGPRRVFPIVPFSDKVAPDGDVLSHLRQLEGENALLRLENRSLKRKLKVLEAAASPPSPPPPAKVTPKTHYRCLD